MNNYNPNHDAHKLSNYKEIKDRINKITDVIVDLSVAGVKPKTVQRVLKCLRKKKDFILYAEDSMIGICPRYLVSYHVNSKGLTKYEDMRQLINALKLIMLYHTELCVIDLCIDKLLKKLENANS